MDKFLFKRGNKAKLPQLQTGEPFLSKDEERLYIGGNNGNIPLPNKQDINEVTAQLAQITVQITSFGASSLALDNTQAIQSAIDHVSSLGGGIVLIPKGTFIVIGKSETIYLRSNVSLKGTGKESIIKVSDTTGDWGSLFRFPSEAIHDVEISNFTIDCNINNTNLTETNRWADSNRVLLHLNEGYNVSVHDMFLRTNGVWAIRGKISYSRIYNNKIEFDSSTYPLEEFDTSTIWIGGEENWIYNNHIYATENSSFFPATGIEFQGHRTHCYGNKVENFRTGVIFTSITSYENKYHVISELGSNHTKIYDNIFSIITAGIIVWPMNVPEGSAIRGLDIHDNTIYFKRTKETRRVGIRTYLGNVNSSVPSDADQTAAIYDLNIKNNRIEFEIRNVNTSAYAGDHGIFIECDVKVDGLNISNNTFKNVGGLGVYLNESPQNETYPNNEWITNFIIKDNEFMECKQPIRTYRNISDGVIKGNVFMQKSMYDSFGDNMLVTVECDTIVNTNNKNITILDNIIRTPKELKPFYPQYNLIGAGLSTFPFSKGYILEKNTPETELVFSSPSGKGVTITDEKFIRLMDNSLKKTTYGIGGTVGTLKTASGGNVEVIESVDNRTFIVNDATNLHPSQIILLDKTKFNTDLAIVLYIAGNTVYCPQDVGLKTGAALPSAISYFANLVTA